MNELKNIIVFPGNLKDTISVGTKDPEQLLQLVELYFNGIVNEIEKDDDMWYVKIPLVNIIHLRPGKITFV